MIVEPIAADHPGDNVDNPVSRLYYNASTMICVPTSLAQEVGEALGAQAGEAKLTEVLEAPASVASDAPPRDRSTWCSKRDPRHPCPVIAHPISKSLASRNPIDDASLYRMAPAIRSDFSVNFISFAILSRSLQKSITT